MGPYGGGAAHFGLDINIACRNYSNRPDFHRLSFPSPLNLIRVQKQPLVYAIAAGVFVGGYEYAHFNFRVMDQGGEYLLDPWILIRCGFSTAT